MLRPRRAGAAFLGSLFLLLAEPPLPSAGSSPGGTAAPPVSTLPLPMVARDLAAHGLGVTAGAAPGYVDEAACALCHPALAASYREKGMARAFGRPRPANDIEDFAAGPFVHVASGQHLQIVRRGDRLVFRRWQLDGDGRPINLFEQDVDWILGSGDHARTYLYRTGSEFYQLPLAWYTQERSWGMAPGFDRPDHEGVLRRVRRECVFCHASYPDLPAGADAHGAPQVFPEQMTGGAEGIGCQRCHGPGAEHVWLALGGIGSLEEIRASVFSLGRQPAPRRDEVCMSCHLQPSVALSGLRRFGRGDFSFRPGEPLAGYLVQVDVDEEGRAPDERFEINHHPYRLRQSRCSQESGGALSCLTCHDPHRRLPEPQRVAHYRAACLTCHQADDCDGASGGAHRTVEQSDCAGCHMPKRRTQDVVHVVMTDHKIQRAPGGPELLAPRAESEPVLTGIRLLDPHAPEAPRGALAEVYRAAAVVRAAATTEALDRLERTLAAARPAEPEPWLDLAGGFLQRGRFAAAEAALAAVRERAPRHPTAAEWQALALAGQGRSDEAVALLRELVAGGPHRAEAEYNLGRLLMVRGRAAEAEALLARAVAGRPNLVAAWFRLGETRAALGRRDEALACYRRALELDPTHTGAYLALGEGLLAAGDRGEALRWLRHGARAAAQPARVAAALAEAEKPASSP